MAASGSTADFRTHKMIRDGEGHHMVGEGSVQNEDVAILDVYAPNNRAGKHVKQKLTELQRETEKPTLVVGDFNTPLSTTDRAARQKTSKDTEELTPPSTNTGQPFPQHHQTTAPRVLSPCLRTRARTDPVAPGAPFALRFIQTWAGVGGSV